MFVGKTLTRHLRTAAAAVALTVFCCARAGAQDAAAPKPNILWITCEDHGPDMPFYGDPHSHMPHLSRLAEEGCVFTRAFSTAPVCAPSRSAIITGVHAVTIGSQHMRSTVPLPPHIKLLPAYLREAGYYCTNNVKTDYNFRVPANAWDENSTRAHWRNRSDPSQPFFSVFNLTVTHEGKYKVPEQKYRELTKDLPDEHRLDPATVVLPPYYPDTPVTRKDWARHYDLASQMDIEAGRLLKQLADDGLATSTIVFFFSDHGVGLPRGKRWLYDAGLQVPLVIKAPGVIEPATRNGELVSLVDLAPTVLTLAGLEVPQVMQGRIFLGPKRQPAPKHVFATRDRIDNAEDTSRAVRDERFKYIKNYRPEVPYAQPSPYADGNPTMQEMRRMLAEGTLTGPATLLFSKQKPPEEFYDTQSDPHEIRNLASDPAYAQMITAMRTALAQWQQQVKDDPLTPEPAAQKKRAQRDRNRKRQARQ
jgi:N-sulfoglucosamine sulfohydrolase